MCGRFACCWARGGGSGGVDRSGGAGWQLGGGRSGELGVEFVDDPLEAKDVCARVGENLAREARKVPAPRPATPASATTPARIRHATARPFVTNLLILPIGLPASSLIVKSHASSPASVVPNWAISPSRETN